MADNQTNKRIVDELLQLLGGASLTVARILNEYRVSERTAQRDLEQLQRLPLVVRVSERPVTCRATSRAEVPAGIILMLEKVVLDSRALGVHELQTLLKAASALAPADAVPVIAAAVQEELRNYQPIKSYHERARAIWQAEVAIQNRECVQIEFRDHAAADDPPVETLIGVPLALSFNKQYFHISLYVLAGGTVGQVRNLHMDWILHWQYARDWQAPAVPAADTGEQRRVTAYGYRGKPVTITFEYYGLTEYVTDQYSTARVIKHLDKPNRYPFPVALMAMDVDYSSGVRMWLLTQSPILKVVSPQWVATEVTDLLKASLARYVGQ